jgi:hypothetical protein
MKIEDVYKYHGYFSDSVRSVFVFFLCKLRYRFEMFYFRVSAKVRLNLGYIAVVDPYWDPTRAGG